MTELVFLWGEMGTESAIRRTSFPSRLLLDQVLKEFRFSIRITSLHKLFPLFLRLCVLLGLLSTLIFPICQARAMMLNVQDFGKEASPCLGMHDLSLVGSVPSPCADPFLNHRTPLTEPTWLEAGHNSGGSENSMPASIAQPIPGAQNPGANGPVGSAGLFRVYMPDWYPRYTLCMKYFLDQGQYTAAVQSLAAYINIRLPYQRLTNPVVCFGGGTDPNSMEEGRRTSQATLRHYIRRLVVTGNDTPAHFEAFFGPEWLGGVESIWKQERMNYLFTAKSCGWAATRKAYDILPDEQTPFLRPLNGVSEQELTWAESLWSEWLAMEDWMVGPRSPAQWDD